MLKYLLLSSVLAAPALAASASDWQNRTIYQVSCPFLKHVGPTLIFFACQLVTDRFATTDGSSPTCNTEDRKYCGGTWQGVVKKLDYIQGMGFDAVWISPVVKNVEGTTAYGEAFHG